MSYRDNNNIPIYPGAYFMNYGTFSGGNGVFGFPIYGSVYSYYYSFNSGSSDNWYILLPGFKIIVYTGQGYTGNTTTFDNTNGTKIKEYTLTNYVDQGNSCKLYYNNIELSGVYSPNNGTSLF